MSIHNDKSIQLAAGLLVLLSNFIINYSWLNLDFGLSNRKLSNNFCLLKQSNCNRVEFFKLKAHVSAAKLKDAPNKRTSPHESKIK